MKKPKPLKLKTAWAYFSPDGYIQIRSISEVKNISREMISMHEIWTYKDYEKEGYYLRKVKVNIELL